MDFIKANLTDSTISADVRLSLEELHNLETALSIAYRTFYQEDPNQLSDRNFEFSKLIEEVRELIKESEKLLPPMSPKEQLKTLVAKFKKWITDNYDAEKIKERLIDDPGYPAWSDIHNYFGEILKNKWLNDLDEEDKLNLLYLIARDWDIGSMIAWLLADKPLSNSGNLSDEDFIDLAQILAAQNGVEFEDAKSQFASSFKKFENLTPEIEGILLKFYETGEEYSKRHSLISLAKMNYRDTKTLVQKSWAEKFSFADEEELHKVACLQIISENLKDSEMLNEYLKQISVDESEYFKNFVENLNFENQ